MEKVKAIGSIAREQISHTHTSSSRSISFPNSLQQRVVTNRQSYEINFGFENLQNSLYYCCFDIENFTKPTQTETDPRECQAMLQKLYYKHCVRNFSTFENVARIERVCDPLDRSEVAKASDCLAIYFGINSSQCCTMFQSPIHTSSS